MIWQRSHRFDRNVLPLADRHYNRQKPGTNQFAPAGSAFVLKVIEDGATVAFWITYAPQFGKHAWHPSWLCSAFRNESEHLASSLIRTAIAASLYHYGTPPENGMVTFVNPKEVPAAMRRGKPIYGYCFLKAGFSHVGFTQGGLWAWQLLPEAMPEPARWMDPQDVLFVDGAA